jgi:hypothetical protein
MAAFYTDSQNNYSPLNPVPIYRKNLPANFETIQPQISSKNKTINYKNNNVEGYYEKYQQHSTINYDRARQATQGFFEKNHISVVFFSDENMNRIQKKIREEVYKRTNGQYQLDEDQDESDLTIVMRALYLDKCKNLPGETVRQVKLLNQQTLDYIVPDLISNIKQYFGYIKDINQPLKPMMRPMNVNNAGRRQLSSICTIWK